MTSADLSNPILNSPYDPPEAHFEIGPNGPTGTVLPGRRPSESFIPVPPTRKGKKTADVEALTLDLMDTTGERREQNTLINDIRREVERWRANNWNGVTPYTRKLLSHWAAAPPQRDDPVLFCQREAAETAIFLAEVAGRHGTADYRRRLEPENRLHNDRLPRVGLKMATGTGKTVVMAMLIAWQTINKVMTPSDARFAKRFLVVTPGITIRDRLGVLHPEREDSYYRERDLIPSDLWDALLQAQVEIVNYHTFLPRDAKEIQGVAANTRKLLRGDRPDLADAFTETADMVAARVLRAFGSAKGEIVVLNDEAHHCYQDKLLEHPEEKADKEELERNRDARVWFRGLVDIRRKAGIKTVYDLSATPYYLKGSGYNEGFIFPWVVSDFSLMDAIESGIVKVPRIPVDDDAAGKEVVYLRLWDHIDPPLPKRKSAKDTDLGPQGWTMPATLQGALLSLYKSYQANHARYEETLAALGEPPPVMIVVCPNTVVSKLMFDWIAGRKAILPDGTERLVEGNLPLLSNVVDGRWDTRPSTILVDSAQLESGDDLGVDFRKDAAAEVEAFKAAYRLRNPGADVDKLTDADLLREAMNTIGKKGKLGENIRCVVSVAMLTEGWDANTVTHILGVRPFRSQLLCEQVVGRGLRRRSYATNEDGRFEPEYAEIYGVPFAFIPGDHQPPKPKDPRPAVEVRAVDDRWRLAIRFPKLDGYRVEVPDERLHADFDESSRLHLAQQEMTAMWVQSEGVIGQSEEISLDEIVNARPQKVAFELAKALVESERFFAAYDGVERPWLFPQLVEISRRWLDSCVTTDPGVTVGYLLLAQARARAAEKVYRSIVSYPGSRTGLLLPVIRRFDSEGSSDEVRFVTRKVVMDPPPTKSPLNHVVLDGIRGNSWEEALARLLEDDERVLSYVKNERLGFTIPYVHAGRSHDYIPDFLVRLVNRGEDVDRTLIVEVSGSRKSPGPTEAKATTARNQWCAAANHDGRWGRWGYVEVHNPSTEWPDLDAAIDALYMDQSITGLPA
jgi:type III restriction enzyme